VVEPGSGCSIHSCATMKFYYVHIWFFVDKNESNLHYSKFLSDNGEDKAINFARECIIHKYKNIEIKRLEVEVLSVDDIDIQV
jgi:hypothetical protein